MRLLKKKQVETDVFEDTGVLELDKSQKKNVNELFNQALKEALVASKLLKFFVWLYDK